MKEFSLINLISVAGALVSNANKIDGRGRTGGCLCLADTSGPILIVDLGEVPDQDKRNTFRVNATEKAMRVAKSFSVQRRESISSWGTRDPEAKRYGGGIGIPDGYSIAVSGYSEHVDEAFSATVAFKTGMMPDSDWWWRIKDLSQNPHMRCHGVLGSILPD